jgi:hypothetical protein
MMTKHKHHLIGLFISDEDNKLDTIETWPNFSGGDFLLWRLPSLFSSTGRRLKHRLQMLQLIDDLGKEAHVLVTFKVCFRTSLKNRTRLKSLPVTNGFSNL